MTGNHLDEYQTGSDEFFSCVNECRFFASSYEFTGVKTREVDCTFQLIQSVIAFVYTHYLNTFSQAFDSFK